MLDNNCNYLYLVTNNLMLLRNFPLLRLFRLQRRKVRLIQLGKAYIVIAEIHFDKSLLRAYQYYIFSHLRWEITLKYNQFLIWQPFVLYVHLLIRRTFEEQLE